MASNENCVVAFFPDGIWADAAVGKLRQWDERVKDVKLGTIGKIFRGENNKLIVDIVQTGGLLERKLHLNDEQLTVIGNYVTGGLVAVGVNADDYEVAMLKTNLEMAGGSVVPIGEVYDEKELAEARKALDDAIQRGAFENTTDNALNIAAINKTGFN